jgi:hypothetical protein
MPYVQRSPETNEIIGLYATLQPGIAEEYLPDDNPEVMNFLHPKQNWIYTTDWISRFTNQEYLAVCKQRAADIAANKVGYSKNWDIVATSDTVDLLHQKTQRIMDDLVLAGVLTQARADEICS